MFICILQVVFFAGVQLDITKADPKAEKAPQSPAKEVAREQSPGCSAASELKIANGVESEQLGGAHEHLTASTENLLAGLKLLAPAEKSLGASAQNDAPQPRGEVGPQEKQMQRSVVGTVSDQYFEILV